MTLRRYLIDLPVPEDEKGNIHSDLSEKPTSGQLQEMANMKWEHIVSASIRRLKKYSVDINPSKPPVEKSRATIHKCHHDETPPKPCDKEEDI